MTILIFKTPIEIAKLSDILLHLNKITPETNLLISLSGNTYITKISIFPDVPAEKVANMEKMVSEFGATLNL